MPSYNTPAEAVEAVSAIDADAEALEVMGDIPAAQPLVVDTSQNRSNVYTAMLAVAAVAYLGALIMALFHLRTYCDPEKFLW